MALRIETSTVHPPKAEVVLIQPIPRPEWRIPPPPFKGPHTPETKEKNRIANTGKKRKPEFGPKIGELMVEVWKRDEYRERRKGIKRNHSRGTRDKITARLQALWKEDKNYRDKILKIRRSKPWREQASANTRKRWRKIQFADELELWKYAEENQLMPKIVSEGYFTEEKLEQFRQRLFGDNKRKPYLGELDKFSLAVVQLAS